MSISVSPLPVPVLLVLTLYLNPYPTETHLWITFIVVCCYLVLLPMWVMIVLRNEYTRPVLKSGWVPVLSALCISG